MRRLLGGFEMVLRASSLRLGKMSPVPDIQRLKAGVEIALKLRLQWYFE